MKCLVVSFEILNSLFVPAYQMTSCAVTTNSVSLKCKCATAKPSVPTALMRSTVSHQIPLPPVSRDRKQTSTCNWEITGILY